MTRLTPFQTIMTRGRLAAAIGLSLLGFLLASPPVLAIHYAKVLRKLTEIEFQERVVQL